MSTRAQRMKNRETLKEITSNEPQEQQVVKPAVKPKGKTRQKTKPMKQQTKENVVIKENMVKEPVVSKENIVKECVRQSKRSRTKAVKFDSSASQDAKPTLFCLCKKPYVEGEQMIGCDSCDDWFHFDCVKISPKQAKNIREYTCPQCTTPKATKSARKPAQTKKKKINLQEAVCKCRKPYKAGQQALRCGGCSEWFHLRCVDIKMEEAANIKNYSCQFCQKASIVRNVASKMSTFPKLGAKDLEVFARDLGLLLTGKKSDVMTRLLVFITRPVAEVFAGLRLSKVSNIGDEARTRNFNLLSADELAKLCNTCMLPSIGTKEDLVERMLGFVGTRQTKTPKKPVKKTEGKKKSPKKNSAPMEVTPENVNSLTMKQLKEQCQKLGLQSGLSKKDILATKLKAHLMANASNEAKEKEKRRILREVATHPDGCACDPCLSIMINGLNIF